MNTTRWLDDYYARHPSFRSVWDQLDIVQVGVLEMAIMRAQQDAAEDAIQMTVNKAREIRKAASV